VTAAAPVPGATDRSWRAFLDDLAPVDTAEVKRRAQSLAAGGGVDGGVDTAIALTDLTTLESTDTPGRVRRLCARALRPDPADATAPTVAAVCVYPDLVEVAAGALRGSGVRVAAVAGAFPSGRSPRAIKLAEVRAARDAGADEIDYVLDRGAFLGGRYGAVAEELAGVKAVCRDAHLKVILEVGELGDLTAVRAAAWLALAAGADVVKTSTGKIPSGASLVTTLVLLEAAADAEAATGRPRGVKAAGGIRTAADALGYLALVSAVAGPAWLTPARFRFGASSLLDDLVARRRAS
jgi:deoxyribose-phosphate aldolase